VYLGIPVLFSRFVSARTAAFVAIVIGIAAAVAAAVIPHSVRLSGVGLGDIGLPVAGMKLFLQGQTPYGLRLRGTPAPLYPFTTMVMLWPLTLLPLQWVVSAFLGLSSAALAYGIGRHGARWQFLIFLSPPYWAAIESVQWSPLVTASLLLPALLPIAILAKPQLALVPAVNGKWSIRTLAATVAIVLISIIVWPAWPVEWWQRGNLQTFVGYSPLLVLPGFLLLAAALAWRTPSGRLVLAMSLPLQRYFYDQLPLFLIPKTWRQMILMLLSAWTVVAVCFWRGWAAFGSGAQHKHVWIAVVIGMFLPALGITLYNWKRDPK
jgi:hypothetical protein